MKQTKSFDMTLDDELSEISVVSLEQAVAAPYCGLLLASAGARVIKVERPEGDFARSYDSGIDGKSAIFAWLNRGKESIALNLKNKKDKFILKKIINRSDIFLSNLTPQALKRLELDYTNLKSDNPKLIYCKITGYGESEEASTRKAYDMLVQAESGLCSVTGTEESPSKVGISITDLSTGLTAFSAILRALIQRAKTNRGVQISISMFDVMADWMNMPLLAHRFMGGAPKRNGLKHTFIAPYGAFTCGDDTQILLSIQNNREFSVFCNKVLENESLSKDIKFRDNPQRYQNREELDGIISRSFKKMTRKQVQNKLNKFGIANAQLNDVGQLSDHEFLTNEEAHFAARSLPLAALPVKTKKGTPKKVPELNEDGDNIRAELI